MEWADLEKGTNRFPKQPFLELTVWLVYILVFLDCVAKTKVLSGHNKISVTIVRIILDKFKNLSEIGT